MKTVGVALVLVAVAVFACLPSTTLALDCGPRVCVPERPIPPETVGPIGIPFDLPVWPTIIKTEFNIIPWMSFKRVSICLPGSCKAIVCPAPCFSLKPLPVWFPWLRPVDVECTPSPCWVP
jgi:hypothetical protein